MQPFEPGHDVLALELFQRLVDRRRRRRLDAVRRLSSLERNWAWAGDTPFHHTKLIASHFGGTRNPMAVSWPKRITPHSTPRAQFHHVNDATHRFVEARLFDFAPLGGHFEPKKP